MLPNVCEILRMMLSRPTPSEVLEQNANAAICTSTQCFTTVDDLVPMHAPHVNDAWTTFLPLFLIALVALGMLSRRRATNGLPPSDVASKVRLD